MRVLIRDDGSGYGQIAGARTFRDVAERSRQRWAQNQQRAEQMRRMQDYRRRLAAWDDRPAPEAPAPLAPAPARPAPWQIAAQDNPDVPRWYEAIADFGPAMRAMRDRGLDLMRRDTERRDNAWAAGRQAEQQQQALAPYVSSALGWRAGTMEATSAARDDDAWWAQRVAADRARNVADIAERRDAEDAAVLSSPALMQSILERWRGQMLSAIDNPPPVEVAPATAPRISGWGLEVPRPDTGAPGITSSATVAGQTISPPATPLLPTRPLPPVPIDSFTGRPMSLGAGPGDPEAAPWWLQGQAREIQNKIETRNARINDPNYFKWAGDNRFFRELGANISNEADQVFTYFQQAAGAIPIGNLPKLWGGQPIYPDMTIAQGVYPMLGVLNRAFNPFYTALRRPGALPTPWELAGPARPGETPWAYAERALNLADPGPDLDRFARRNAYLASLPPEIRAIRGMEVAADVSGIGARAAAGKLINDKMYSDIWHDKAIAAMLSGHDDIAARYYAYATYLDNTSYSDLIHLNDNPWAIAVEGAIFDITNLIPFGALGKVVKNIRAENIPLALGNIDEAMKLGAREAEQILQGQAANVAVRGFSWVDTAPFIGKTADAKAHVDRDIVFGAFARLLSGVESTEQARLLLDAFFKEPGKLFTGVKAIDPDLIAAAGEGGIKFGAQSFANTQLLDRSWLVQMVKDKVPDFRTLKASGFNAVDFFAELDTELYRAARERYGLAALDLPDDAVTYNLVKQADGTYRMVYLNEDGKEVFESAPMAEAEALAYRLNLDKAVKAGQSGTIMKTLHAITGVQREVLSTMFLALRPGHWIRNAAAATATLVADDLYSLRSTANVIGDLARKGVPVPSPRMGEGLFPKQFGVGAAAEGMTGGVRERAAWNIYGKAKDFGNQVWTGNIELLGRVPFGEQAFYTKAYAKSFERGFRTLWQSVVKHDILPQFSGLGLTPEQIQPLLDLITDVGIYGSRADVARAVRNAVTRGYTPFSLRSLGIPDELIEPDFQRTLTKAVNDWLGSDNPLSQESLAAIHRTINETFDAARAQPLRTIQQAPPQVGVYTDSSKVAAEDAAEVIDTLTDEARRAGISYKQVQPQLQEFAAQVTAQMQATGNTIVQEIRALPPDDRSHVNIIFDAWARIGDMRDEARRAVDNLSETAVAASQSADRAQAQAAWNKKWEETRRIYDDLATAEQQVLAEMREDFARVSNGETFAPRYRYQDAMDRYLDADMQAIEEARKVETGAATDPAERQKFQTVIKANRAFTDLSRTTLYGAFARYPSPVALDIVVQTERQSADIGSMAAAHLAPLRAQARKARTAEGWAAYFAERNKTWREAADSTHTLYLNASRLIVLSGESEKIAAAVRWSANGVDYILEAPLGAGKWQAYRLTDGRRLVVGAGEKIAVPEQQARAYYTVTQQVEAEVDAVMDSIIAETAQASPDILSRWREGDSLGVLERPDVGDTSAIQQELVTGIRRNTDEIIANAGTSTSVSPSLSPGAGGAVGAPSAPDEEPVDEAAAILRRIMDADEPMTQEEFVALAQRRAELDPTAPRYEPLPAGDVDLGMTPTPAVPPAPPPMTDAHRRRLHALGRELHGKGWDDVRPTMAEEVSNGRTTHTAMLTGPEADELIRRLEELKRSRKPVAPPPPKSASRESIAAEARKAFKLKPQQIADYMAVLDARAETWAEQTGRKVEEYYSSTFAEIKRTKLTTEGALRQEGITYAPKEKRTGGPILDTRGMGKPGKKQTGSEPNYLITYPEASQRPQWRNTLGTPGPETLPPRDPNAQPFLYQKTSEIARGEVQFLDDGRAVIHAFRSADFSTLVHETFHVFRRDLARVAKVNQQAAKDLAALEKAAGVVGGKWTREAEELVAGWGERYMMEGVAPTPALEGPFSRLKKWLTNIYRRVAAQDQPGADLSPEVRQVFDRMLGAQEAPVRLADDVAVSAPTRAPEAPVAPVESPWRAGQRVTARRATGQTVTGVITDERPELGGVRIRTDDGRLVSVPQANVTPLQEAPWQPIPRRPVTSGEPMPRPGQPSRSPLTPRQRVTVETPAGPVEGEIVEATAKQVTIATDNGMTVKVNPENVAPVEGAIPAEVPTVASQQTPAPAQVAPAPAPASTVVKLGDGRWEWRTTNLNGETVEGIATTRKAAQQRVAIWSQTKIAPPSTFSATTPTPAPSVLDELAARVDDGDAGAVQEYAAKRFTEGPPSQSVDISTAVTEPVLDVPAPVRVQQPAPGIVGRTTQAWSDPAHPYTMRYEVVEYDSLVPSNLPDGRVNPRYPAELQPRDRTQAASQAQVQKMAQQLAPAELLADTNAIDRGSPVVGLTNAVESGNGRMMAFGLATQETINKYKAALLDAADSFGLPREAIEQMQKPVLVRRRMDGDAIDFAREANARVTLGMNAVETGKQLAQQLTPGDLSRLAEAGGANALMLKQTLSQQGAMEFIRRLMALVPPAERAALVGPDGSLTSQAVDLIRSSLFSVVFEDDAFLRNYVLAATPDLRNIGNGVEQAIAKLAFLQKSNPELAIGDAISEAAMTLARLRDEGTSVAQHLSQMGMFGQMSDEAALLLRYFDTNMRSGKAIADLLNEYADAALRFNANQAVMFAEAATPSRAELLQRAIDAVADGVSSQQTKLFQPAKETFDTPAIKSALANRGTYDPTTPNILYQSARRRSTGIDWFGLGRTQNAARDLWEWTKKHWRYGMQTPTMGDVGAHQVRSLDDAQRKLMEALPGLAARRTPNTLSVAQRQGVLKVLTDTIAPRFDDAVFGAQGIAQRNADGSMLNYRDRRGFDTALGLLFPYHFFWSRSAKNWLKRSLEHPAMLNLYYEQEKAIQTENRQAGVPTRLKGTVPLWTRSDGSQVRIQNPLHYALPFNMYFPGSVYNDPAEAESEAERWLMRIRNYTPGLFPLWSWLLDKTLDSYSPLPGGEKRTDSYFTGSYFPVAGISALASQALRSGPGMAQWATGPYQPYRVARAIALIAKRDGLNPNLIGWAQQIALNVDRGRPLYENVEKAYRKEAYDLYIQGKQEAARDRLAQSGVGYATGTNAYIWRPEEPQLAQASRQYSQAGYNPRTQPMGSKAAQQEVMQGEPYLPGWWNKSNLLPQGQRPWEPTPGQSSTVSMLYEQQEPIYAAMAKAVADYLTQNPDATRADITAIKEPFYARLGPLKERLQGIPQRGTSLKGMNPTERALYEIEKLYGYEPPNKPQPPGEGAAPATLQAYYANLAAWEDARLRRIDANLRQLMAEEPSYPEEWRSLLPVLLGGRYTANLLETYEQRPMSPVEAAWDSRLTFAREITAQEWATRKQQVAHLVGPQAVALFEQYLSTPTGPERQALKESNPLYGAAIEAAFNPREYAQGVATWGPAWYQIATGAPKHPGDGASEAQLQQYYNAMDAYRERNPLYDAIKLWYRGRPNAQVANLPDGAYIPNDYGKDYQQAISIFGADIFALRQQRSEAYAKSKETGYAWDDAHQPELKRIKGYGVWYNEEAKQPPTLAQEQQIVIPDVNAYRGPRPVGTDLPPLGADLPAPGNRGILPPQTVTAPATAPEAPQGSTTPPQAQTPATAPQTGAAGPFGLPAAPATQNAPVAPAAGEITQAFEEGRLYLPFDGQRAAVQGYGENPQNYARFGLDGHEGMDWMMPEGTPIYAAAAGTVETVAYSPSEYGNYVVIRHEDGSQTLYAHFQQATVQVGDEVTPSDQIGLSGNTGNSTGPHLHFGYRPPGADLQDGMRGWVDPSGILVGREGEAPQPGVQWDLVNQYANQDVRYVASQAKRKVWEQRKQAVAQQFGAEIAGYFQQYLDLPEGAARQDFKAQHPELRAVNLFTFQPQVWAQATKIFTPDIIMAWAKAPAWGESEAAQERRKQYFVQNPGAWEFGAWLNGRPTSDDEGDIGSEADDWKYNAGRDYNTAKKRFGEDIWELAKQYRSADQATRRSLRGQFPQIMAFFDWWYGNLPQRQDAVASSGRLRVGRNPHYVRRSYGGSSGYGGYARTPRIYPTDARELQRDLWYGPERADRPWAPEPLDTRGFEIRTLQQRLQDWEAPTPPDDLRLPRAPEEARRLFRGR